MPTKRNANSSLQPLLKSGYFLPLSSRNPQMLWILTLWDPPLANLAPSLLAAFSTPLAMSLMVKKLLVDLVQLWSFVCFVGVLDECHGDISLLFPLGTLYYQVCCLTLWADFWVGGTLGSNFTDWEWRHAISLALSVLRDSPVPIVFLCSCWTCMALLLQHGLGVFLLRPLT